MTDVLIVGGGPAGAIAALVLARAGVDVTILDRAVFPRDKLCGDSVNPGAMALLARHGLAGEVEAEGIAGVGHAGHRTWRCRRSRRLPWRRRRAVHATATSTGSCSTRRFAPACTGARRSRRTPLVAGVNAGSARDRPRRAHAQAAPSPRPARVVIAADGRRSTVAFALGLARHPQRPRRWAIGAYFEGVTGLSDVGEMHVRRGHYIGVAPVPGGLTNACLVVPESRGAFDRLGTRRRPRSRACATTRASGRGSSAARRATPVTMLGPLAVDVDSAGVEGLLLAGDAAGFIDPMTGDGLRLAMRGGELAAAAALESLEGQVDAHVRLTERRRSELGTKLRVNRLVRSLVARPGGVRTAAACASVWPSLLARLIAYAGDVPAT